ASSPVSPDLRPKLALARARALAATGKPGLAIQTLVTFISDVPSGPFVDRIFAQLEAVGAFKTADTLPQLEAWAASPNTTLSSLAQFYTAITLHNTGAITAAITGLQSFRTSTPSGPLTERAAVELASWLISSGNSADAIALLDPLIAVETPAPLKSHANFLRAKAHLAADELTEAANAFAAAGAGDTPGAQAASYNAALANLRANQDAEFTSRAAALKASPQTTDIHARLLLERSLFAFATGHEEVLKLADEFLASYPGHPGAYRIHIALAEHAAFTFFPARTKSARDHLAAARAAAKEAPAAITEHLDYIAFRIAGSADDPTPLLALGSAFLDKWPASGNLDRVRMKLGENHFRLGDFPNARLQFEKLADQAPSSPLAEPALFFAARAAVSTISPGSLDAAITLWQRVTELGGPLAPYAREQQALAQRRLGRNDEAILIYESILKSEPPPAPDLRVSALIGLGEAHFDQSRDDPEMITAALVAFDQILTDTSASPVWKHRALFHKGKSLEKLERTDDALEAYYDIISTQETGSGVASPAEQIWFYRAGFEAISMLEAEQNWPAAINIADRLASAGGPRAPEAKDRAERLRLEHLVWDE
ncbi:MAG: tetratricopeptide repeat protein, partial [Verrucomicrobiales bacterium]|nr:tetratricopeptide repeat protein [Verrucomicrobiales bacterium]